MELLNPTPLTARLWIGALDQNSRLGRVVAKATFRVNQDGRTELEEERPHDCYDADVETELGLLPRDDVPGAPTGKIEALLLAVAHAPRQEPVRELRLGLRVGPTYRELIVVGDRERRPTLLGHRVTEPLPFLRMPLSWERALGGTQRVRFGGDTELDLSHPANPAGRGLDARPLARRLGRWLGRAPADVAYDHRLPNLESPSGADGAPACWATRPSSMLGSSSGDVGRGAGLHMPRGHADWVIAAPEAGALVRADHTTPRGAFSFRLPALRVRAEGYCAGKRSDFELPMERLLLLPQERRFVVSFGRQLILPRAPEQKRALRLHVTVGESPS